MNADPYAGTPNLEALLEARHYNRFLCDEVLKASRGSDTALDFGAGVGTFAVMLRTAGLAVSCVEPDSRLRARLVEQGFEVASGLDVIAEGSVRFLYSLNVLEHIEDDRAALEALRARLQPDARFFLYVPAFSVLYSSMDAKVGHFRRYRRAGLTGLARQAGFVVERAHYADSLGFLASLLYRAFGSADGDLSPASVRFYDRVVFPLSRICDRLGCCRLFGKNLVLVLRCPGSD